MKPIKLATALLALAIQLPALAGGQIPVKLFKNPSCYCCDLYAKHLERNGFKVELVNTTDMAGVKHKYAIPDKLEGCHTALVGGYIVEGLVPARFVRQMLKEHPKIKGISLPGMPVGAPGMNGAKSQPLTVYRIQAGPATAAAQVYGIF